MSPWAWIVLATSLTLGAATPAAAVDSVLVTPNVTAAYLDTTYCRIVNTGTQTIRVRVEHLGVTGGHYGDDYLDVAPGTVGIKAPFVYGISMNVHCRFTGSFVKTAVRASIDVRSGTTNRSVVVAPAR
jgi:hypothetical protein